LTFHVGSFNDGLNDRACPVSTLEAGGAKADLQAMVLRESEPSVTALDEGM